MVFQSTEVKEKKQATSSDSKHMRIAYNCRSFMSRQYTGIGRYASRLINALKGIDQENEFILYAPKGIFNRSKVLPKVEADNFTLKVDRFKRGLSKTVGEIDIYHALSPEVFDIKNAKVIVTVHDLVYRAFPQGHTQETLRLTDEQFHYFLPLSSKIICCSQNTADDLRRFFDVDDHQIRVIYPGIDRSIFYKMEGEERERAKRFLKGKGIKDAYILFVGTLEPRKNLKNILESFAQLKHEKNYSGSLVICGMAGWGDDNLKETIVEQKIEADVKLLGFCKDEELRTLYNFADVFVFPSLYEGFGYPIVEAFSCGAAVITSNVASSPEVASDAAMMVDPADPSAITAAVSQVLEDSELRDSLIEKGFDRAKFFDFSETAQSTLEVYREVYES